MAIEAKASFLRQMEKKLSTTTTADMMAKVLSIVSDVMIGRLAVMAHVRPMRYIKRRWRL